MTTARVCSALTWNMARRLAVGVLFASAIGGCWRNDSPSTRGVDGGSATTEGVDAGPLPLIQCSKRWLTTPEVDEVTPQESSWWRSLRTNSYTSFPVITAVAVAPSGEIFIAGRDAPNEVDFGIDAVGSGSSFVVAYGPDQTPKWLRRVPSRVWSLSVDESAHALFVDSFGEFEACEGSDARDGVETLSAFSFGGRLRWSQRFRGNKYDIGGALTVAPNGQGQVAVVVLEPRYPENEGKVSIVVLSVDGDVLKEVDTRVVPYGGYDQFFVQFVGDSLYLAGKAHPTSDFGLGPVAHAQGVVVFVARFSATTQRFDWVRSIVGGGLEFEPSFSGMVVDDQSLVVGVNDPLGTVGDPFGHSSVVRYAVTDGSFQSIFSIGGRSSIRGVQKTTQGVFVTASSQSATAVGPFLLPGDDQPRLYALSVGAVVGEVRAFPEMIIKDPYCSVLRDDHGSMVVVAGYGSRAAADAPSVSGSVNQVVVAHFE